MTKKCPKCMSIKNEKDFSFRNKRKGTRQSWCKICIARYDKIAYKEGKKTGNSRESKQALRARNLSFVYSILSSSSCTDCGNSDIRVLEFDHLRDKKYNIGVMIGSCSIKSITAEINKCEVVCANCHKIRTFTRIPNCKRIEYYNNSRV